MKPLLPALFVVGLAIAVAEAADCKIYYSSGATEVQTIERADLDGTNVETVHTGDFPSQMDVDPVGGKVYWLAPAAVAGQSILRRADLDGSNVEDVWPADSYGIFRVDPGAGLIYYTKNAADRIWRATLDGSVREPLVRFTDATPVVLARSLAVDAANDRLYWTNTSSSLSVIQYTNLAGTDTVVSVVVAGSSAPPNGIDVDPAAGKLYWQDVAGIWSADLDVGSPGILVPPPEGQGSSANNNLRLDPAAGFLYWSRQAEGEIYRCELPTCTPVPIGALTDTRSVALDTTCSSTPPSCVGFEVNTTDDLDDGLCNASHCSLREALIAADADSGPDTICFDIPGPGPHVITPATALPIIDFPLLIDGYSEPDAVPGTSSAPGPIDAAPSVVLQGAGPTGSVNHGLRIEGLDVTVRGLVVQGFPRGIFVRLAGNAAIEGCFLGTEPSGLGAVSNHHAIEITGSAGTRIGGLKPELRNLISGNAGEGITMVQSPDTRVEGNLIGVDKSGVAPLGNGSRGIVVSDSDDVQVGGGTAGASNVIGANGADQVFLTGGAGVSERSVVQGNYLGTDPTGTVDLGGNISGILWFHVADALIGGTAPNEGNLIAYNAIGVQTATNASATDTHNRILGNRIWANAPSAGDALGIDLAGNGVTPNDHCDADSGTNDLQNFPVLTGITNDPAGVTIDGELDGAPITDPMVSDPRYLIEFFANSACDSSGYGEGERFLGRALIAPPDEISCLSGFSIFLPVAVDGGWFVTATATDPFGSTSEFSACLEAPPVTGGAGAVPDGATVPGPPLTAAREPNGDLTLFWSDSCSASDIDYEIYEGNLGTYYDHVPVQCTTGGMTSATFTPSSGDRYYLVVPTNGNVDGSHGRDGSQVERPVPPGACAAQVLATTCP